MTSPAMPQAHTDAQPAVNRLQTTMIIAITVFFALLTLYAVFMAQGTTLHEFAHDGRHLFGAPCH